MNRIENVVHQAENAARTQITRGAAHVMRESSIVNAAAQELNKTQIKASSAVNIKKSGVYTKGGPDGRQYMEAGTAYTAVRSVPVFDISSPGIPRQGVRRSPVQAIRTAEGYYKRLALRIAGGAVLILLLVGACIVLLRYWGY